MEEVPASQQFFVLMDVNTRTGRREEGGGSVDSRVLGTFGCDVLNNNG